jgi:hypothetical protein
MGTRNCTAGAGEGALDPEALLEMLVADDDGEAVLKPKDVVSGARQQVRRCVHRDCERHQRDHRPNKRQYDAF